MAVSVECIAVEHPGPELAERIASFDWVVFIDASASTETVRMTRVTGSETAWTLHSAGVCRLLGIAQFLYARAPSAAILVEIPGYIYDRGEGLSRQTELATQEAVRLVEQLVHAGSPQDSFLQLCGAC